MTEPRVTRRTVLAGAAAAGAAAAGAGSLIGPAGSMAAGVDRRRPVFSRWIGTVARESPELAAPRRFALAAVEWARPADARIELRARSLSGRWSPWALASVLGHGPDAAPGPDRGRRLGEGIWTGPAQSVQLRSSRPLEGVRLQFVEVGPGLGPASDAGSNAASAGSAAGSLPLAQPVLNAGPGQPPIIARSGWAHGAPPRVLPGYGAVRLAFVHHTENPNGYSAAEVPAMLLAIYQFHRYGRGWNDIGYNFVVDAFGRVWEARQGGIDQAVIGAQAGAYNAVSTGVAILGSFGSVAPSRAALGAVERLLAWKLALHGVPARGRVTVVVDPADAFYTPFRPGAHVSLPRIAGHRDGDSTDCPGDALYALLPEVRRAVAGLAGRPSTLTLTPSRASGTAPATVTLAGRALGPSGAPLAGTPVALQRLSAGREAALASLTTAADGSFAASVTVTRNLLVRALRVQAPALASELVEIAVAPVVELHSDPASPRRISGTVTPGKRSVTIDVIALAHGHRRLVTRQRVAVRRGRFSARLRIRRSGRYLLRASTGADASNAAGASPPLSIVL